MRHAVKQFHDADGVRGEGPGEPRDELSQRKDDQAGEDSQPAEDHHCGLHRQDERIGDERDEGDAFEMICHDRNGGELRGKGQDDVFVDDARKHAGILF